MTSVPTYSSGHSQGLDLHLQEIVDGLPRHSASVGEKLAGINAETMIMELIRIGSSMSTGCTMREILADMKRRTFRITMDRKTRIALERAFIATGAMEFVDD